MDFASAEGRNILIVAPYGTRESFQKFVANRLLLKGLDRFRLRWVLHEPWQDAPPLDAYDAALFWSWGYRKRNYRFFARRFEHLLARANVPIINSARNSSPLHSVWLKAWNEHGLPCARYQRFSNFDNVGLRFPMILRCDGQHKGRQMYLVHTREEAVERIRIERNRCYQDSGQGYVFQPLDLAIEFIETRFTDGLYRKRRSYVIGDKVICRSQSVAEHWTVNFQSMVCGELPVRENARFRAEGEPDSEILIRAARAAGVEIAAIDYVRTEDGRTILWEGNRHFRMTGDKHYQSPKFNLVVGRTDAERQEDDEQVGLAFAQFVVNRMLKSAGETVGGSIPAAQHQLTPPS